ncbi:MAG: HEPN domain-containing protein [Candidatus Methanomethylicia archaeon]
MSETTNIKLAISALKRAGRWLMGAFRALEDGRWDDVVYSSQMVVEQSSKAVLIALGIDYPKEHDVSIAFKHILKLKNIPEWFIVLIDELSDNISELAELRGLAGYGYEEGIDVDYFKDYAPIAYEKAKKHYDACSRLLRELFHLNVDHV